MIFEIVLVSTVVVGMVLLAIFFGGGYKKEKALLTPAEHNFFSQVLARLEGKYRVATKVRIADIVQPKSKSPKALYGITSKHADFVLCSRENFEPLLVIELDDSSHQRKDRKKRDVFVDKVYKSAKLPILHVKAKKTYDAEALVSEIEAKLLSLADS